MNRRDFLVSVGAAAGSAVVATGAAGSGATSPNETVGLGFIGIGNRGRDVLKHFLGSPLTRVVALCDVNEANLGRAHKMVSREVAAVHDFRELLGRKDVDAVVIETNDHWHAIPAILACQAGKDVYVEKPLALTVEEGRRVVDAAEKERRIVQIGTQQRAGTHYHDAVARIQSGALGRISAVHIWNVENFAPQGFGRYPDSDPPAELDWDFWLGPRRRVPFNRSRIAGYYWYWDYGGGVLTGWGPHHFDVVHWAMGVTAPLAAVATGGRYAVDDNTETPDTMEAVYDYPGFQAHYTIRYGNNQPILGRSFGIAFYGTDAMLVIDRDGFEIVPQGKQRRAGAKGERHGGSALDGPHQHAFLEAVKSRSKPAADALAGHQATNPCHLGNMAYFAGRKVHWNEHDETADVEGEAAKFLARDYRGPWKLPEV